MESITFPRHLYYSKDTLLGILASEDCGKDRT